MDSEERTRKISERFRKNQQSVFSTLAEKGQVNVAESLNLSESTVSRMKSKEIPEVCKLIAACGLKVVPEGYICAEPEVYKAALIFAKKGIEQINNDTNLLFD